MTSWAPKSTVGPRDCTSCAQGIRGLEVGVGKGKGTEMVAPVSLTSFLGRSGPQCWRIVAASPWGPERRGSKDLCIALG